MNTFDAIDRKPPAFRRYPRQAQPVIYPAPHENCIATIEHADIEQLATYVGRAANRLVSILRARGMDLHHPASDALDAASLLVNDLCDEVAAVRRGEGE